MDPATRKEVAEWIEANTNTSPDRLFDRLWAMRLMDTALNEVRERYRAKGQEALFELLNPWSRQAVSSLDPGEVARELGMSEAAVRVAAFRLRQRYGACLQKHVAETLDPGSDPADEIRYLIATFT